MWAMSNSRGWPKTVLLWIGSLGPFGLVPASGTVTVAVVGTALFAGLSSLTTGRYLAFVTVWVLLSVWVHQAGDRILGEKDSRRLVWDEVAGFLVAVTLVPFTWQLAVIAFLIERALDILKVPPAKWIEDHWPGGWGVVGDDIIAGLYTCGLLHLLIRGVPVWMGLPELR